MSKQDRQGARTVTDLERRYSLGKIDKAYDQASKLPSYVSQAMDVMSSEMERKINQLVLKMETDLAEALKDYVKTDDYDAFKQTLQTVLEGFNLAINECVGREEYGAFTQSISSTMEDVVRFLNADEGWIPLAVDSAFIVRNNDDSLKPVCKVTGNVVTVCGVVSNVAEMESTSSGVVFASGIPEAYRPNMDHHFVCQGSGMNRWQCSVKTDGTLMVSRYGTTAPGTMGENTWLPFSCTYQI